MSDLDTILLDDFKEREIEILDLMAAGRTNAAIGERLFITKETVRWYNKQIYSKLGTSRRTEAIARARQLGLIGGGEETAVSPFPHPSAHPKHNLPTIATPFLGRTREIKRLGELLTQPQTPLVTILGPGGIGKTRLAIEAGHQLLDKFKDGVYLFELAAITRSDTILHSVLDALQLNNEEQLAKETLIDYCRGKELLLIFDNFEQVLEGSVLLNELIRAAPEIRVLVTSRERLNLYGETIYRLSGLQKDGAALFIASAKMLEADFELAEGEDAAIERIVTLVGGLPLALILAASWVEDLTVGEIAEEIAGDLDMLTTDMRNVPERQRSMRTILAASWQQLLPEEQLVCMRLAVFKGGFSRAAASKIAEMSLPLLQKLRHKSFIQRVAERRYDMHPLVQQFVGEKLEASKQFAGVQRRHLLYFQSHIAEIMEAFTYGDIIHPLNQVALEHENVRAALNWSLERDDAPEAILLAKAMFHFWDNRSHTDEAIYYLDLALDRTPKSKLWAELSLQQYRFLGKLGNNARNEIVVRDVLAFAEANEDIALQMRAYAALCNLLYDQAKYRKLLDVAEKYGDASRAMRQRKDLGQALSFLSSAHSALGNFQAGNDMARQAVELGRESEDDVLVARLTYNLAISLIWNQNRLQEALPLIEESLSLKRLIGDRAGVISRLALLARIEGVNGRFDQAKAYLDEAQAAANTISDPKRKLYVLLAYSILYKMQEKWPEAIRTAKQALSIAREHHHFYTIIGAHINLAQNYLQMNLPNQGRHHLTQALENVLANEKRNAHALLLLTLSRYFQVQGDLQKSSHLFFIYLGNDLFEPENQKFIAQLPKALQPHFTPDEWATRVREAAETNIESVLRQHLAELKQV